MDTLNKTLLLAMNITLMISTFDLILILLSVLSLLLTFYHGQIVNKIYHQKVVSSFVFPYNFKLRLIDFCSGFCRPDMPAANPDNPMMDNVTYATTLSTTPYATTEGFYVTTAENNATTMNMDVVVPKTTEEP